MTTLLVYLPFLVPAVVAQFAERERWARYVTYGLVIAINLVLLGFTGLALLNYVAATYMPQVAQTAGLSVNWLAIAAACLLTSILAFLPLIPQVRRALARLLPIDPESAVHTIVLTFAIYEIGLSLAEMGLIGSLENLTQSGLTLTIWDIVLTGVPLTLFALAGVGLFIRRDWRSTLERLGLRRPTGRQVMLAAGLTVLFLGLDLATNLAWERIDPTSYDLLNRVTNNLFGGLSTVGGALVLGLSAGISEELLFRGALLPRLGLILTTVLFTIGHLQYGFSVATAEVFVIGLILGLVRYRTNTTTCILIHASYNTLTVLLGMWQP